MSSSPSSSIATAPQRVWLITGTSSGLGLHLAQLALAQGDCVIATSRKVDVPSLQQLGAEHPEKLKVLRLDVTDDYARIQACADEAVGFWGRVDVVVNNAGHGFVALIEEGGYEGLQLQMNANTFGPLKVTQAFLPHMRKRREGLLVYISSRSSYRSKIPLAGFYAASKAALDAYVASLSVELKPLNIRVLNVLPGGLKTSNWANVVYLNDPNTTPTSPLLQNLYSDYSPVREPGLKWMAEQGKPEAEFGDPVKAAQAVVDVIMERSGKPCPEFLALGADAERDIRAKCEAVLENLEEWKDVTRSVTLKNDL